MVRFYNYDIVFAEIPDEVSLALNITGCPNRCPGCHSTHLQQNIGDVLDTDALEVLLGIYGRAVTCVCFMGGDGRASERIVQAILYHFGITNERPEDFK